MSKMSLINELVAPFLELELFPSLFADNPTKLVSMVRAHAYVNFKLSEDEKISIANIKCIQQLTYILHLRLFNKFQIKKCIQETKLLTYEEKLRAYRYSNSNGFDGERGTYIFFIHNIYNEQNIVRIQNVYSDSLYDRLEKGERLNLNGHYFLEKYQGHLRLWRTHKMPTPTLVGYLLPDVSTLVIFTFEKEDFIPLMISDMNMNS